MGSYVINRSSLYEIAGVGLNNKTANWDFGKGSIITGDRRHAYGHHYKMEGSMLFRNLKLPSDAVITKATLQMSINGFISDQVNTRIYIQTTEAKKFADYADYMSRPRSGYIEWDDVETGANIESPDFSELIPNVNDLCVFWGDIDGRTPVPDYPLSNNVIVNGWPTLRIEFDSVIGIPQKRDPVTHEIAEAFDITPELSVDEIFNDLRVILPNYMRQPDYSVDPPVMVPIDYTTIRTNIESQNKYGRRTKIVNRLLNDVYGHTTCEAHLLKSKEPVETVKLKLIGEGDNIYHCLDTHIGDTYILDMPNLEGEYIVENVNLKFGSVMVLTVLLSLLTRKEYFKLDMHEIDKEVVLA